MLRDAATTFRASLTIGKADVDVRLLEPIFLPTELSERVWLSITRIASDSSSETMKFIATILATVALALVFNSAACAAAPANNGELPNPSTSKDMQTTTDSMSDINTNIVLFSFIGDSLALGPHWVYDQDEIQTKLGRVDSYQAPISNYHPGKAAGDFTHYGDQTLVLLKSLATDGGCDSGKFAARWRAFWEDPTNVSYRDHATRQTLEHLQTGSPPDRAGSDSHDIAGAARIGPLFLLDWENDAALIDAARRETALTHAAPEVVETAEFFCRVVLAVRSGANIPDALEATMASKDWPALPKTWLPAARKSAASEATDSAALKAHGLTCNTDNAFPGVCHLLLRYPTAPAAALIANASAGGDNAARGMMLGLVYGAKFSTTELPPEWLSGLNARDEIVSLIQQISHNQGSAEKP